jgi:hypothetical protein
VSRAGIEPATTGLKGMKEKPLLFNHLYAQIRSYVEILLTESGAI